mgnify:CR=1 FL=1
MGSSIDDSGRVGFLAPSQVSNYLVQIVVVFPGIRIAVAPHLCNDFILMHFQSPPIAAPKECRFQDKNIPRRHIWI